MSDDAWPPADQQATEALRRRRQEAMPRDLAEPLCDDEVEWLDADLTRFVPDDPFRMIESFTAERQP